MAQSHAADYAIFARQGDLAMGSGTDAEIVSEFPVIEIMTRLAFWLAVG